MSDYQFIFTDWFNRNLKSLGKHNPHLRTDLETFLATFEAEAHPIIPQTGGARKARMKTKGRGKRGGYRVVYYVMMGHTIYLITVYDKVKQENLSSDEQSQIYHLIATIQSQETE